MVALCANATLSVQVVQMKKDAEDAGYPAKRLGVTWNGLTVKGKANTAVLHDTVFSLFDIPGKIKAGRRPAPDKVILQESFGCVRPGQVLLVLARPGGGATTLLNVLSNNRAGYSEVEGDVLFGSMDHEQAKQYRGEIIMNGEEVSADSSRTPSCRMTTEWIPCTLGNFLSLNDCRSHHRGRCWSEDSGTRHEGRQVTRRAPKESYGLFPPKHGDFPYEKYQGWKRVH